MNRPHKTPGKLHPITVEPEPARVVVRAGGRVIADTTAALTLKESVYPAVRYIPLSDVDPAVLRPSTKQTYCPYKGDASYYSLVVTRPDTGETEELTDAVWTYEQPYPAVEAIASHVAFYPDQVEITVGE
ncbi:MULTISPECIES: DUF427 domain-containing protein [Amycolatopsis]|uniref:Uncharacterized conserved protein, DUF427 family n=2 Tax=Amycolatopsis TaxID=1813 RepID=A0A1I3R229_9PSEU|nr:DUF427 domain-containing protein [Amycolatopsis sacchari]SFJ39759.1 Uncharacterized conserved protein, DUF427 family [Amycolatopsis sacchari]